MNAQQLAAHLQLLPHPEGGFYKETYRSSESIPTAGLPARFKDGERSIATMIYFLLVDDNFSAFHKIKSDEGWHFYTGTAIRITEISPDGQLKETLLGSDIASGQTFQHLVPAGHWFASEVVGRSGYALVGCTVAPGFSFEDFEMASRHELLHLYPHLRKTIEQLTRWFIFIIFRE